MESFLLLSLFLLPLIFLPGYFFTSKFNLSFLERIAYSFTVSITILVSLQLVLGLLELPISIYSFIILGIFVSIISLLNSKFPIISLLLKPKSIPTLKFSFTETSSFLRNSILQSQLLVDGKSTLRSLSKDPVKLLLYVLPLILIVAYIIAASFYFPFAYAGDGTIQLIIIKDIAIHYSLPDHHPLRYTISDAGIYRPVPIEYPTAFHVFLAPLWEIGQNDFLKMAPAFFAFLTYVFSFLLLRKFTTYWAGIGSALVLLVTIDRFVSPVLLESLLLAFALGAIYCYVKMLQHPTNNNFIILTGIMLGFSIAIKQQGLVLFVMILFHFVIYKIYNSIRLNYFSSSSTSTLSPSTSSSTLSPIISSSKTPLNKTSPKISIPKSYYIPTAIFIVVTLLVTLPTYSDLYLRNGTIIGADIFALRDLPIPLHDPIYEMNDGLIALQDRISYWFVYDSFEQPFFNSLIWLVCRCVPTNIEIAAFYAIPVLSLVTFSYFFSSKKHFLIMSSFAFVFFGEILTAFIRNDRIEQYHQLALAIIAIQFFIGLIMLFQFLRQNLNIKKIIAIALSILILIFMIHSSVSSFLDYDSRFWNADVRIDNSVLHEFQVMGNFMNENIPEDAKTIGFHNGFRLFSDRITTWIHVTGGAKIPELFEARDVYTSLSLLKDYDIDYIALDTRQTKNRGFGDSVPPIGLFSNLNKFNNFELLHKSDSEQLLLYKINYCPENNVESLNFLFDRQTQKWNKVIATNLNSELSTVVGDAMIIVSGTGDSPQYVRYESDLGNLVAGNYTVLHLQWNTPSNDLITGDVQLFGPDSTYTIHLADYDKKEATIFLSPGSTFNTISLNLIMDDNITNESYFVFSDITIYSTSSLCLK